MSFFKKKPIVKPSSFVHHFSLSADDVTFTHSGRMPIAAAGQTFKASSPIKFSNFPVWDLESVRLRDLSCSNCHSVQVT